MKKYRDLKEEIKKVGKITFLAGLNNTHSGNISVRIGNRILITRRGSMLGFLSDKDIIETGLEEDDPATVLASSEINIHRAIYRNTQRLAIVHVHPITAIALSFKYDELIPIDIEGSYYLKKIPVVEFKEPTGSKEMEEGLPPWFAKYQAVIVRGHGLFTAGKTLEEALHYAYLTEDIAKIIHKTESIGIDYKKIREKQLLNGNNYK